MQYMVDYVNKYRLGGPQYGDARSDFLAGRLGTECSFGLFGIPQMKSANLQYTIKPAPRCADATSDNGFDAYALLHDGQRALAPANQKAAWKYARMYLDRSVELFEKAGLFVPRQEVLTSPGYKSDPGIGLIVDELRKAKFVPSIPGYDQVLDILLKGRDQMVQGRPARRECPAGNQRRNEHRAWREREPAPAGNDGRRRGNESSGSDRRSCAPALYRDATSGRRRPVQPVIAAAARCALVGARLRAPGRGLFRHVQRIPSVVRLLSEPDRL